MTEESEDQNPQPLSNQMLYFIIGGCAAIGIGIVAMAGGNILGEFGLDRFGETTSRWVSFLVGGSAGIVVGTVLATVIWHSRK